MLSKQFLKTTINYKSIDKEYMQELIIILSSYNLVVYLLNERNLVTSDKNFVDKLDKEIGNIDNFNDIFIDDFNTYIYKNRRNIYGTNGLVTIPPHLYNYENKETRTVALFDKQLKKLIIN